MQTHAQISMNSAPGTRLTVPARPGRQPWAGSAQRARHWSLLALLCLGACAQVPTLGPQASLPHPQTQAGQSLAGLARSAWPQDEWWTLYGDPQLDALMQEALREAPTLQVALARLNQAAAVAEQQGAALKPSTQASLSANRQRQSYNNGIPAAFVPQGWNNYGQAALQLSQELDLWGRQRDLLAAATSSWTAAQADLAQARLALSTQLAQAYADLARLHALADSADAARQARERSTALMRARRQQGLETEAAVQQARARQAQAEGEWLALQESIALQRHLLAALLGAGPDRGLGLSRPRVDLARLQGLPDGLALDLLGRRPDIVAARLRAEASSQQIDAARKAFYPNIKLSASLGFSSLGLDMLSRSDSLTGSIGPALSLPLFDQGRLSGQYRQAHAAQAEAVAHYHQTLTQALQEVADVVASEAALDGRLTQAQQARDAAHQAWQLMQARYAGGLASALDVLSAEDSYLAQARELTQLQARRFSLDVTLIKALGGGYRTPA
jgi:NodT family efflux transporter outer membrane factor (OMF) lipoprotein